MRTFAAVLVAVTTVTLSAQLRVPEIDSIRQADMRSDLTFLASDAMGGRLTDTPQNAVAAEWIASRFARLALKPIGDNGTYFQRFQLAVASLGEGNTSSIGAPGSDW
jgi:hypothetical protein